MASSARGAALHGACSLCYNRRDSRISNHPHHLTTPPQSTNNDVTDPHSLHRECIIARVISCLLSASYRILPALPCLSTPSDSLDMNKHFLLYNKPPSCIIHPPHLSSFSPSICSPFPASSPSKRIVLVHPTCMHYFSSTLTPPNHTRMDQHFAPSRLFIVVFRISLLFRLCFFHRRCCCCFFISRLFSTIAAHHPEAQHSTAQRKRRGWFQPPSRLQYLEAPRLDAGVASGSHLSVYPSIHRSILSYPIHRRIRHPPIHPIHPSAAYPSYPSIAPIYVFIDICICTCPHASYVFLYSPALKLCFFRTR